MQEYVHLLSASLPILSSLPLSSASLSLSPCELIGSSVLGNLISCGVHLAIHVLNVVGSCDDHYF